MRAYFGKQALWSRDWNYVFKKKIDLLDYDSLPFPCFSSSQTQWPQAFPSSMEDSSALEDTLTTHTKTLTTLSHLLRHHPVSPLSLTARNLLEKASLISIQSRSPVCPCGLLGWCPHNSETLSTYSNRHSGCSQYQLKDNMWIELETHKDLCLI